MDRNLKLYIVGCAATAGATIAFYKVISEISYRKTKKQIEANTKAEIERIKIAGERVQEMIRNGKYDQNTSIAQIFEDFEFERQVANFEE